MTLPPRTNTRQGLIDSARTAFASKGFDRAATAAIASAAGCSEPTLFKYFGSKVGLLVAVLRDAQDSVFGTLDLAVAEAGGDFDVFAATAAQIIASPLFGEMARLRSFALTRVDDADVRSAVVDGVAGFDALLTSRLEAGQRAGAVRSDIPAGHLSELILGLMLAAGFRYALEGEDAAENLSPVIASLLAMMRPSRDYQQGRQP